MKSDKYLRHITVAICVVRLAEVPLELLTANLMFQIIIFAVDGVSNPG